MKNKKITFLLSFVLGWLIYNPCTAQILPTSISSPDGGAVIATAIRYKLLGDQDYIYVVTTKAIYVYDVNTSGQAVGSPKQKYIVKGDVNIVDAKPKFSYTNSASGIGSRFFMSILVLLDNGYTFHFVGNDKTIYWDPIWSDPKESPKKIVGDDLYAISNHLCFVSRDVPDNKIWTLDTAGVGNNFKYNLDLDSNQRVYMATDKGLFMQELVSNTWIKNTNLGSNFCSFVFVDDRRNRVYAQVSGQLKVSVDDGASFQNAPSGLSSAVNAMCADIYGNIYCISNRKIYKSTGGTQPFVAIDQNILNQIQEPLDNNTFTSMDADSNIVVGSKYGIFTSGDKGSTWTHFGIPALINYGIAKTTAGRLVVSNNVGVHTREANNKSWTKRFPASGVETSSKIFKDNTGNLYTTSQSNKRIWKSTDNGTTWNLDTVSYSNIKGNVYSFYTDPLGNQHAYVLASPPLVYTKNTGGIWMLDTVGFKAANFSTATAWGTDNNSNLYLATASTLLQKRPIAGGTWVTDIAGLNSQAFVYDLAVDASGTLWAGTYIGAYKKVAGVWQQLNYPTGTKIGVTNSCFVVSVDGAGAVWTQWSYFNDLGHAIGSGVYFTTDGGNKWTTMDFDTITFRQLYSVGDTTYAMSYANGLFRFTRDGLPNSVKEISDKNTQGVFIYPNPATNVLNLESKNGLINKIEITNVLGKMVWQQKNINELQTSIDISRLAKGIYLIEVTGKDFKVLQKWVKE